MPRSSSCRPRPTSARPSLPSICCTTATTCWWAVSVRTSIACRSSSATPTGGLAGCGHQRQQQVLPGTDSAPHARHAKEAACGCAGCYTAYAAIELYAEAFEQRNALDKLEGFASLHGPAFYGLPANTDTITLVREEWTAPDSLPLGDNTVIPCAQARSCAGVCWRVRRERSVLRRRPEGQGSGARHPMAERFRGYLPVVVDVETGGFNSATDALLEIAAVTIGMDEKGFLFPEHTYFYRVEPFEGANIEPAALEFTGIKLDHPLRMAVSEETALTDIFRGVRKALKANGCKRAILVGHNSSFDLNFLNAAVARTDLKRNPFHPFSSFDTATLAGLAYGQTVLARACQSADIDFDGREAHSARYDTEKTAELFCGIVNRWKEMGGWRDFND